MSTDSIAAGAGADGCGATVATVTLPANVDLSTQAVIQGRVASNGAPLGTGYARLLDATGEFAGEVPISEEGVFRFFAAEGTWTVRIIAPGGTTQDVAVDAEVGKVVEADITL